jgi:hypothetical protein
VRTRRQVRGGSAWLLAAALLLSSAAAEARTHRGKVARAKAGAACQAAYRGAQLLEQDGQLVAAQNRFQVCARAVCGSPMQRRCLARSARLEEDIPSIVPVVTDATGAPLVEVRVTLDGKPILSRVEGRSVAVDPGAHELAFEADGDLTATVKIVAAQGQRNHPVPVTLGAPGGAPAPEVVAAEAPVKPALPAVSTPAPPPQEDLARRLQAPSPPPREPASRSSVAPYLLSGVGVVGLGGGALLTYWGRKDNQELAGCAPSCPPETVHHIRMLYLGADLAFVVGGLALGTATLLWLGSGSSETDHRRASARVGIGVRPTPSGASGTIAGTF